MALPKPTTSKLEKPTPSQSNFWGCHKFGDECLCFVTPDSQGPKLSTEKVEEPKVECVTPRVKPNVNGGL